MVLAGLVAGGITASTAFSPALPADSGSATASPRRDVVFVGAAAATPDQSAPLGSIRVQEAAIAEWEYRTSLPVAASRSTTTPGSFVRPSSGGRTGWFGERRRSHRHGGIDFDGETGDPVVSAGSGIVVYSGWAPEGYGGYGQMVLIDHGEGITTLYAHLSRIDVPVGAAVQPGEGIASIGTTGSVTGSHLHFELRVGGRPVNPANWISE